MPTIRYDENAPSFNTNDIVEDERSVEKFLSFPNVKVLGSDQGCGCGFRHAIYDDKGWIEVISSEGSSSDNRNHEKLVEFISNNNRGEKFVELFVLWGGDIYPAEHKETIKLNRILNSDFYFRERGLYTVEL